MELPAWYRRLVLLTIREDREIEPYDFDEDISELREGEGDSGSDDLGVECKCRSEDECECYLSEDSKESERSYLGSHADYYYELKHLRISRKMELRDDKELQQEERLRTRQQEKNLVQLVYAAYEAMLEEQKKGDCPCPRLTSLVGKTFYLYSVDHVDYCYNDFIYSSKYVEFNSNFDSSDDEAGDGRDGADEITGHVYLNGSSGCEFEPFRPPERAGPQKIPLKILGSDPEPIFQFISDKYLTMTVRADSEMISRDIGRAEAETADVPDVFRFVGIHMDWEERNRVEAEALPEGQPCNHSSPGNTFFETSHPMGAWNMGW